MKRTISIRMPLIATALLLILMIALLRGQGDSKSKAVTGTWDGTLDYSSVEGAPPGKTARLVVHIRSEGGHLTATMATPEEGPQVVAADDVEFKNGALTIKVSKRLAVITANINSEGTQLRGSFNQEPYHLALALKKSPGS